VKFASKMFTLTALALACSAASAQQTASMAVTGNITPSGCTASFSNKGKFDLRVYFKDWLSSSGNTYLHPANNNDRVSFNISCPAAAQVAWRITDNRPGSEYGPSRDDQFGLSKDKDGNPIGAYSLLMTAPILDGVAAYVMESRDNGSSWSRVPVAQGMGKMKDSRLYTYSKTGNTEQKGSSFSSTISFSVWVAPTSTLNTSDVIDIDGSATIDLMYR